MNKNLSFVLTQKAINKEMINKKVEYFFGQTKLHSFQNKKNKNFSSEEYRFKKPKNKNLIPAINHHSIETFIEATRFEIQGKVKKA